MDKWRRYGSYENWKESNLRLLKNQHEADKDRIRDMIEPPSFDDFCMGKWQWLD